MDTNTTRCPEDDMRGEELEAYYRAMWKDHQELAEIGRQIDEEFEKALNEIFPERW